MARIALRFGRSQHLIGVLHEAENAKQPMGILLWNTGISHRIGPYRIHVDLAERLAALGFTVLRFDLSRLGDSDVAEADAAIQDIFTRDINDAVQVLEEQFQLKEILSIGICSGAVDAWYHARQDPRVRGLVMVDGFVYPTFRHELGFLLQRLLSPKRWQRLIMRALRPRAKQYALQPVNDFLDPNYPPQDQANIDTQKLIDRGTQMLVLYTGGFHPWYSYRRQFQAMLRKVKFRKQLQLEHWPHVDHLFTLLEDRKRFMRMLHIWIQDKFLQPYLQRQMQSQVEALPMANTSSDLTSPEPVQTLIYATEPPLDLSLAAADAVLEVPLATPQPINDIPVEAKVPAIEPIPQDETLLPQILEIYNSILYPSTIEADDNFFEFGGNSILAIKASLLLSTQLGQPIPITLIFSHLRPRELARALSRGTANQSIPSDLSLPLSTPLPDQSISSNSEAIAIIGMACKVPGAKNIDEFWDLIHKGQEGISHFQRAELDSSLPESMVKHANYVASRGIIDGNRFDHEFFGINRREALFLDPQQRVLLETCWQALEDAGWAHRRQAARIGVYVGVGSNTYQTRNLLMGHAKPHSEEEYFATMANDKDYVATHMAYHLDLRGPAVSVHTACSTSLVAVVEGIKTLITNEADIVVAGAASVNAPMISGHLYQEGGIFSRDGHCRPFAADATGTLFSDGSAVVVLKKLDRALADGDPIHAVIRGWALNNDGRNKSSFAAPSVEGQSAVIRKAYQRAGWSPRSVAYMECHGTATPIGDPIEVEGLRQAFQEQTADKNFCALGSVKANIGHLTAAAGTIGLIKAALVLRKGIVPPALHALPLNPELRLQQSPFYIPEAAQPWLSEERRAGVSSFGVGGTNAHVLLEAHRSVDRQSRPHSLDPWVTLTWSAKDPLTCQRFIAEWPRFLGPGFDHLLDMSYVSSSQRPRFHYRQSVTARDAEDLRQGLSRFKKAPIYYPDKVPSVVLMFPGQGSQYPRMGQDLARVWPRFAQHYERVIDLFESNFEIDLRGALDGIEADGSMLLHTTLYTQPALFSVEWALATSLIECGIPVTALIGHSIGEISAAAIAGVFSLDDAVFLVYHRARTMQSAPLGTMLAVRANHERIKNLLVPEISLCVINSTDSCVVGGESKAVEALLPMLKSKGIAFKQLETSHAFHSSMMDQVIDTFRESVQALTLHPPKWPIISTVDGRAILPERLCSIDYWVDQIRQPVNFLEAVRWVSKQHDALFLEVGPRDALSRFVRQILRDEGRWPSQALLARSAASGGEELAFTEGLSELANYGIQPFVAQNGQTLGIPSYPFFGEKLWLDPKKSEAVEPRGLSKPQTVQQPSAAEVMSNPASKATSIWQQRLTQSLSTLMGLESQELDPQLSWTSLGIDSILLTQWSLKMQKEWGINMNLNLLQNELQNLQALALHMQKTLPLQTSAPKVVASDALSRPNPQQNESLSKELSAPLAALDPASIGEVLQQQIRLMTKQIELLSGIMRNQPQEQSMGKPEGQTLAPVQPAPDQQTTLEKIAVSISEHPSINLSSEAPLAPVTLVKNSVIEQLPSFLNRVVHEGDIEFATDQGVLRMPRYRGAFLAIGEDGQPGLFLENPDVAGEYWQVAND